MRNCVGTMNQERLMKMDALQAITERRSCRSFTDRPVEKEKLQTIIHAGLCAASGRNTQSPLILAITDQTTRDALSELNRSIGGWQEGFDPFYGAPAVLLVIADKSVPTYLYDGSLVMGNLMLAAHSQGIASCWIHRAKEELESEQGKELLRSLGIEGDYEGIGHCVLGYADTPAQPIPRKENRVFYIE